MISAAFREDTPQLIARGYRDLGPTKASSFHLVAYVPFDPGPQIDEETAHLLEAVAALDGCHGR
jgi:hypothetical protein